MNLYHKVLYRSDIDIGIVRNTVRKIMKEGLIPKVPDEWKGLLPLDWQTKSIVWLIETDKIRSERERFLQIDTKQLNAQSLHKIIFRDARRKFTGLKGNWWVYNGLIPPRAIKILKDKLI